MGSKGQFSEKSRCPFNFGSKKEECPPSQMHAEVSNTESLNSETRALDYKKYLFDSNLLRENNPHTKDILLQKNFKKCPLAYVLKHYYSSDSDGDSSSVD